MSRKLVFRSLPVLAVLIAGAVVLIVAGGTSVGFVVGFLLVGVSAVLLVSLFFYEVGRSEDRARAWERTRRPGPDANSL
jgi:hypothetical protein